MRHEVDIWTEPRECGVWVRYNPEDPGGMGCEWGLGGVARRPYHDRHDHLIAEFVAAQWAEACVVYEEIMAWCREAL